MELSVSGRQRRAARISNAAPGRREGLTEARSVFQRSKADRQEWSRQALTFLEELDRQDQERQRKLLEAKRQGSGELDMLDKSLKVMDKCRKIASRIMKGDKVPPQDERYLMECDPEGYKLAIACRQPKEKPKEWESVLDDEDREGGSESGGKAAEAADSGGEATEA